MGKYLHLDNNSVELWKQFIDSGDEQAFGKLFRIYAKNLLSFAYSITKDKESALEILDEVFIKIWKNKERLPEITNLTAYLYKATKNTALNCIAKKTTCSITSLDDIDIELRAESSPDQILISSEIQAKIKMAVDSLPPKCKVVFKLVREDGLRYKEVAEILGISEKTVDAQLVIAVKRIGLAVGKYFDYFPARFQKK